MPPNRRSIGTRKPRVAGRSAASREATVATEVLEPPTVTAPTLRRTKGRGPGRDAVVESPETPVETTDVADTEVVDTEVVDDAAEVDAPAGEAAATVTDAPIADDTATETVEVPEATESTDSTVVLEKRPRGRRATRAAAATEEVTEEVERETAAAPAGPSRLRTGARAVVDAPVTRRALIVWGAVALVLVLAASVFGALWYNRENGGPAANHALIDVGATSQVAQQVGEAVKTVYSYDFARLDENEKASRAVITPEFEQQFTQLFTEVRARAPQQKAVVTATVALTGVRQLSDDQAVLVIFMNQIATRTAETGPQQQLASAGRLTVTAKLVDGTWKIADVQAV